MLMHHNKSVHATRARLKTITLKREKTKRRCVECGTTKQQPLHPRKNKDWRPWEEWYIVPGKQKDREKQYRCASCYRKRSSAMKVKQRRRRWV